MSMDTEESLQGVPEPPAQPAARRSHRPAGPHVRLRRQRRAGREGDPHRRQALLGGPRAPLRPRRGRRRRRRATSSPSSPRPGHQRARAGRPGPRADAVDARHPRRPGAHRRGHRDDARGDAGQRDDRAGRHAARPRPTSTWPPSSSTGCCPSCSVAARRRCSSGCASPMPRRCSSSAVGGRRRRSCSTPRELAVTLRRTGAAHLDDAAREPRAAGAAALRARPVHARPRAARDPSVAEALGEELGF